MKGKTAVILHNQVGPGSPKDELDVLVQVDAVRRALAELGYAPLVVPFSLDVDRALRAVRRAAPLFVFNLVESVAGDGRLVHLAPALLEHLGLRFTGSGQEAIYLSSNKLLSKRLFQQAGIPTPPWMENGAPAGAGDPGAGTYLLKSAWEHASNWFADDSVVRAGGRGELLPLLAKKNRGQGAPLPADRGAAAAGPFAGFFAERYVEGREFNQALLAGEALPPAEMRFVEYPPDKLRIVDFRAKWEEDSFEYTHTQRGFDFAAADAPLLAELREIARRCWDHFGLGGYARVDFRVDGDGRPWVLEINANPCLSPDSGFFAAAERAGLSYTRMVGRIVDECLSR
jgi:D-alanine-D-alanine ligase